MNFTLWHRITAAVVFLISTIVFLMTVAPTISFWDCGEFIACSRILGVMHPPGNPLVLLLGRLTTMIPLFKDVGLRMNMMSVVSSTTPGIEENSCRTPSILTAVIAAPSIEDRRIRRSPFPMVVPNPRSIGWAQNRP